MRIAVYGATGHVGGHITTELLRRGVHPVLVGRDNDALRAASGNRGETLVAELADHEALVAAFTDVDVVISSLPAYVTHGAPVLTAALEAGAHYVDLSGEQLWLERVLGEFSVPADAAGVTVVPGITDSNLPGDLLGYITSRQVGAPAEIVISHHTHSGGEGSRGSARTLLASKEWFRSGGWHYLDGELRREPLDRHLSMTFPGDLQPTTVSKFPQPPVLTIPRHSPVSFVTGVLDADIHAAVGSVTPEVVETLPLAPSATADMRYDLVVDAFGADGSTARGVLSGVDSYRDSALMAVAAAVRLVGDGTATTGVRAAAEVFEPTDFLDELTTHGITWRIEKGTVR